MRTLIVILLAVVLTAQTKLDLRNQSRTVDFQSATYTKPLKSGATLPTSCSQGELYFLTAAVPGSNIYACTTTNVWSVQSGAAGGSVGPITIESNDTLIGSRSILNLVPGSGVSSIITDSGSQINIQHIADSAVLLTQAGYQSGQALVCASGANHACALSPTLTTYQKGITLNWLPDVDGAGGNMTLNVDELGSRPVKLQDGATNPSVGDIIAGRMYPLWYDGSVFRLTAPVPVTVLSTTPPACDASNRGRIWHYPAPSGTQDQSSICGKNSADQYAWRALY
jgi:hypothetical protein